MSTPMKNFRAAVVMEKNKANKGVRTIYKRQIH
jgi:hypothetical protein